MSTLPEESHNEDKALLAKATKEVCEQIKKDTLNKKKSNPNIEVIADNYWRNILARRYRLFSQQIVGLREALKFSYSMSAIFPDLISPHDLGAISDVDTRELVQHIVIAKCIDHAEAAELLANPDKKAEAKVKQRVNEASILVEEDVAANLGLQQGFLGKDAEELTMEKVVSAILSDQLSLEPRLY